MTALLGELENLTEGLLIRNNVSQHQLPSLALLALHTSSPLALPVYTAVFGNQPTVASNVFTQRSLHQSFLWVTNSQFEIQVRYI